MALGNLVKAMQESLGQYRAFGSSFGWNLGSSRCPPGARLGRRGAAGCAGTEWGGGGNGEVWGGEKGGKGHFFALGRFHLQRTHPLQSCLAGESGGAETDIFPIFFLEHIVLDY